MTVVRSVLFAAFVGALALSTACGSEPVVTVGRAKSDRSNEAGSRAGNDAAGASGREDREHDDDDDDDSTEHACGEYEPVCGADGMTYPNACQADLAGVRVARRGEC